MKTLLLVTLATFTLTLSALGSHISGTAADYSVLDNAALTSTYAGDIWPNFRCTAQALDCTTCGGLSRCTKGLKHSWCLPHDHGRTCDDSGGVTEDCGNYELYPASPCLGIPTVTPGCDGQNCS